MSDTNYILYQGEDGVRQLEKLSVDKKIEVIGFQRYSVLMGSSDREIYDAEPNGSYPIISYEVFKDLFGKVLTVIDASFDDGERKEALKSLIKNTMSEWYDKNTGYTMKMTKQLVDISNEKS